jgi:hypothetical protein
MLDVLHKKIMNIAAAPCPWDSLDVYLTRIRPSKAVSIFLGLCLAALGYVIWRFMDSGYDLNTLWGSYDTVKIPILILIVTVLSMSGFQIYTSMAVKKDGMVYFFQMEDDQISWKLGPVGGSFTFSDVKYWKIGIRTVVIVPHDQNQTCYIPKRKLSGDDYEGLIKRFTSRIGKPK